MGQSIQLKTSDNKIGSFYKNDIVEIFLSKNGRDNLITSYLNDLVYPLFLFPIIEFKLCFIFNLILLEND